MFVLLFAPNSLILSALKNRLVLPSFIYYFVSSILSRDLEIDICVLSNKLIVLAIWSYMPPAISAISFEFLFCFSNFQMLSTNFIHMINVDGPTIMTCLDCAKLAIEISYF